MNCKTALNVTNIAQCFGKIRQKAKNKPLYTISKYTVVICAGAFKMQDLICIALFGSIFIFPATHVEPVYTCARITFIEKGKRRQTTLPFLFSSAP